MQIVYVVTSSGRDVYSAMTRLSIASLRITNPEAKVTVVVDAESDRSIRAAEDQLVKEVDDWRVVETPAGPPIFRNRFIKTSLRRRIEGAFVFLDSDTLIRGDLQGAFPANCDIAAAANHSTEIRDHQIWGEDQREMDSMGWRLLSSTYFNGGVLFYADTPGAHDFAIEWHALWLEAHEKHGRGRDQPALNIAMNRSGIRVVKLSHAYNAQITMSPQVCVGAKLWHYYSSGCGVEMPGIARLLDSGASNQAVDLELLMAILAEKHPFPGDVWSSDWGIRTRRSLVIELRALMQRQLNYRGCVADILALDDDFGKSVLKKLFLDSYWSSDNDAPTIFRVIARHAPSLLWCHDLRACYRHKLCSNIRIMRKTA